MARETLTGIMRPATAVAVNGLLVTQRKNERYRRTPTDLLGHLGLSVALLGLEIGRDDGERAIRTAAIQVAALAIRIAEEAGSGGDT